MSEKPGGTAVLERPQQAGQPEASAKEDVSIKILGREGHKGQDLLRATAAMDAHDRMQHLASGGKEYKGKWDAIKGTVTEAARHPLKFGQRIYQVGVIDRAIRAQEERSAIARHITLGTEGPLSKPVQQMMQEVAKADVESAHAEKGKLGRIVDRGKKAIQIAQGERDALAKAEQKVAEKMRLAVQTPPEQQSDELRAFAKKNQALIDAYKDVLTGEAAAREALLEQHEIRKDLGEATDAGKQLDGKQKDAFVDKVLVPTIEAALAQKGKLDGVDAELALQHRLLDFGENLSHATNVREVAEQAAREILGAQGHIDGAAAIDSITKWLESRNVNVEVGTVTDESVAHIEAQRSRVTEKAVQRLKEGGGAAEVLMGADSTIDRVNALRATGLETAAAVAGSMVGYAAMRGASAYGRVVGAWVGGTAVAGAFIARKVGKSSERSMSVARTKAAQGEQMGGKTGEIAIMPMASVGEMTGKVTASLEAIKSGNPQALEGALAVLSAVDARNRAGADAGFSLWRVDAGENVHLQKNTLDKQRAALMHELRTSASLPDLKALAARLGVDVTDATDAASHITAIRGELSKALQRNIETGEALGKDMAAILSGHEAQKTVRNAEMAALRQKVKMQATAVAITAAVGGTMAEGVVAAQQVVDAASTVAETVSSVAGTITEARPRMEHVSLETAYDPEGGSDTKQTTEPTPSSEEESKGRRSLGGEEPADQGTPKGGKEAPPQEPPTQTGKPEKVLGKDGYWDEHSAKIDERRWHGEGKGFHTIKGEDGELILKLKQEGLTDTQKQNLSFSFDLPRGAKTEPITVLANDTKNGSLVLDPNSNEMVTIRLEDGKTTEVSQSELFKLLVDKKEFDKVEPGDFASEIHREHRDVFRLGGEDGKGKGTVEATVLTEVKGKDGKTKTVADVFATIRGKGETLEKIETNGATPLPKGEIKEYATPGGFTIEYPGKELNIPAEQLKALDALVAKVPEAKGGSLRIDPNNPTLSWDLVNKDGFTLAENVSIDNKGLHFTSGIIDATGKVGTIPTSKSLDVPPVDLTKPVSTDTDTLLTQVGMKVDSKDTNWVEGPAEQKLHTESHNGGNTIRIVQYGKPTNHIAFQVGDQTLFAEATQGKTKDGTPMSYVDLKLDATDPNDVITFTNNNGTTTTLQRSEFAHMVINEKKLDAYLKDLQEKGVINKKNEGDIGTEEYKGGREIFDLGTKDGNKERPGFIHSANVKADGKVDLVASIHANGELPDKVEITGLTASVATTEKGFTVAGQQFEYAGKVSLDANKNLVDTTANPPKVLFTKEQLAVISKLPPGKDFVLRYDKTASSWDLVNTKDGIAYVQNIDFTGNTLTYTPTPFVEGVTFTNGKFDIKPKANLESYQHTIPFEPTTTPPGKGTTPPSGGQGPSKPPTGSPSTPPTTPPTSGPTTPEATNSPAPTPSAEATPSVAPTPSEVETTAPAETEERETDAPQWVNPTLPSETPSTAPTTPPATEAPTGETTPPPATTEQAVPPIRESDSGSELSWRDPYVLGPIAVGVGLAAGAGLWYARHRAARRSGRLPSSPVVPPGTTFEDYDVVLRSPTPIRTAGPEGRPQRARPLPPQSEPTERPPARGYQTERSSERLSDEILTERKRKGLELLRSIDPSIGYLPTIPASIIDGGENLQKFYERLVSAHAARVHPDKEPLTSGQVRQQFIETFRGNLDIPSRIKTKDEEDRFLGDLYDSGNWEMFRPKPEEPTRGGYPPQPEAPAYPSRTDNRETQRQLSAEELLSRRTQVDRFIGLTKRTRSEAELQAGDEQIISQNGWRDITEALFSDPTTWDRESLFISRLRDEGITEEQYSDARLREIFENNEWVDFFASPQREALLGDDT